MSLTAMPATDVTVERAVSVRCAHCLLPVVGNAERDATHDIATAGVPDASTDASTGASTAASTAASTGGSADAAAPAFCCTGCRTAWMLLHEHGLSAYYAFDDRRDAPVRATDRRFDEFDHAAFQSLHVRPAADGLAETTLYLEGVHCASCVWLVERLPLLLEGTVRAELDVRRSRAQVVWDPSRVPLSSIARTLDRLGYTPHPFRGAARDTIRQREDRRLLVRIGVAGALAGNVMLVAFALYSGEFGGMAAEHARFFRWLAALLTFGALAWPGRVFFASAFAAVRARTMHMDLPIALALAAGFARGALNTWRGTGPVYFDGLALLVFALLAGRYLQQRGQRLASDSAELLASLTPAHARVVDADGTVREVPSEAVVPGMTLRVRAGESFAADGDITSGTTRVDAALLTGESVPVRAGVGDAVYAGTTNVGGAVDVRVSAAGETSRVARLMQDVATLSARRARVVLAADRIAGRFVAVVLTLAIVTFALRVGSDPQRAWDDAIALLVVTCPCALALATPLAVATSVGRAARHGMLVKGGDTLEQLAKPGTLVFDKTGTLTTGWSTIAFWMGDDAVRPLIVALEQQVAHPIAETLRRSWAHVLTRPLAVTDVEQIVGAGVRGTVDGRRVVVGAPAFVAAASPATRAAIDRALASFATAGAALTPVVVTVDGRFAGLAGLGDTIRGEARTVLDDLRARGWRTVLASGDAPSVAQAVGRALGFADDAIHGGLSPEAKCALVMRLRAEGADVTMVGDGINDAPAFAAAHVGIGMHGGAEASLRVADVHLVRPGLQPLATLLEGSRRTMRTIRRNFAFSLAYNAIGVVLALGGLLSPLVAAVLMPLSSVTVVLASWLARTFPEDHARVVSDRPAILPAARVADAAA